MKHEEGWALEEMINVWRTIEALHFQAYTTSTDATVHIRADKLRSKAAMVVLALHHYKLEFEKWSSS